MEKFPSVFLENVEASTTQHDGVTLPYLLTHMRAMFRVENGTVMINSIGYGTFGPVEFKEGIMLGNADIDRPSWNGCHRGGRHPQQVWPNRP
jgi:hypothetical protein